MLVNLKLMKFKYNDRKKRRIAFQNVFYELHIGRDLHVTHKIHINLFHSAYL